MSHEKEIAQSVTNNDWHLPAVLIALLVFGTIGRILSDGQPFEWKRFTGELILAAIGAVLLYAVGMMQGMDLYQILAIGSLGGLGGVRLLEHLIKIWKQLQVKP